MSDSSWREDFELLQSTQRAVLVTFGAVGIVVDQAEQLRHAFAANDRVHATHDLPDLDTFEIRLNPIIDLLAKDHRGQASPAIRDACVSHVVTAFHVLRPPVSVTHFSPLFKYFRHVRNAFGHGMQVTFMDRRTEAIGPAEWRGRRIGLSEEGENVWPAYIGFPSALVLVSDALGERYPTDPPLIARL